MNRSRPKARQLLSSWFLQRADDLMDRIYGERKRAVYAGLPPTIVEIGPGAGANLRYYPEGTALIAVEPNAAMHPHLRKKALRYNIDLQIQAVKGEQMDLPDRSAAAVVGTLVLCSVENPRQVLSEIRRILKPGGRYIFLEHVADLQGTRRRSQQEYLRRVWPRIFDGCHLNRETPQAIREAGFVEVNMDCFMMKSRLLPFAPHIFGVAVN